jgi:hypothetical protein
MTMPALNVHRVAAPPRDVTVRYCDADLALGASNDLYFVLWRCRTTVEGVQTLGANLLDFAKNRSKELALVTIIEQRAKMPDLGTREPLARVLRSVSGQVLVSGVAFEGDGFLAASIRSVVIGLTLIARQPYPHRTFASVEEVSFWFESERKRIGKHFDSGETQAVVAKFRRTVARYG